MALNFSRRQPLHVQPVQPLKVFPSEAPTHEPNEAFDTLLAKLGLQEGVVAHLDLLKTARNILGEGDMRARIEKLLRY